MKNFIFAVCGFLMMSLASLHVHASEVGDIGSKNVTAQVGINVPAIDFISYELSGDFSRVALVYNLYTVDCLNMQFVNTGNVCVQGKTILFPKPPFRYVFSSKYCTHYTYKAYSKLFIPF